MNKWEKYEYATNSEYQYVVIYRDESNILTNDYFKTISHARSFVNALSPACSKVRIYEMLEEYQDED